jgi:chromosome segregation ATPase
LKVKPHHAEQLQESRDQSSNLQVEMREDLERLEDRLRGANELVIDYKSQLGTAKEAMVASKARSDRQVAQLTIEKDAAVGSMRELRSSMAELNEALGLSHVEEARPCAEGVELREQVAALAGEKETNLISWARDKRDRDVTIGALERQCASRATELDEVKAELTAAATWSGVGVASSGRLEGCKCSQYKRTRQ